MSFIDKFLEYNVGTECPSTYLRWAALSALGVAASKRYFFAQGRNFVYPTLGIILVGTQGNRKSYAKDQARDLITDALPNYPIAAAMQSREDIVKIMAQPESLRTFINHEGVSVPFTPLAFFINELKNFLSFNPQGMIEFLTDIWDRRSFDAGTIKRGLERVELPVLNVLACETPIWMMNKLKLGIISGGFGRRFIFVYDSRGKKEVPEPFLPPNANELWTGMIKRIQLIAAGAKVYKWEPSGQARAFFYKWYHQNFIDQDTADEMMQGWLSTKDQQLLRITMLLDLAKNEPTYYLTKDSLELGLAYIDEIEARMSKLFVASGRNELAIPIQRVIEVLEANGGWMTKKDFVKSHLDKEFTPMEQIMVLRHLRDNDRIVEQAMKFPSGGEKHIIATKECYDGWKNNGGLVEKKGKE